ncbi:hypothetical protein TYRP_012075 [Tyrophagus putrescentiae]|nr:hypothetical protein TYRP_012075 [Tyrophagus putrescentiae]
MKRLLTYLTATVAIVCLGSWDAVEAAPPKKKDQCNKNVFDTCADRLMMIGDKEFTFPETIDAMTTRCKEVKTKERCTKDFSQNCLRGDTKNSISVLMYGIAKTNKGYCTNVKRKNVFTSFGKCANTNKKGLEKIFEQMNRDFHGIKSFEDPKLRIPLACCNYFKFKQNVVNLLTGRCSDSNVREAETLIDGYAHDILQLLCGDYTEESDRCNKIIGKTPKYSKPLNYKVFLLPLVDILESI